jgi:hypothetical protein
MMILFIWACTVTCEQVCTTISSCEEIEQDNISEIDCRSACLSQQEQAQEDEREEAFDDLKSCLNTSTCDDIVEGVCYDEELYSW